MASDGRDGPLPGRVLVVDDDRGQAEMLGKVLALEGLDVICRFSPERALEEVARKRPDAIVADYRMPGMTGLELFRQISDPEAPIVFILVTAFGTVERAVEAMQAGVHDFITKPVNMDELLERIKKALLLRSLQQENNRLRRTLQDLQGKAKIVGASRPMQAVMDTVRKVAGSTSTVLLQGESGTGKELVARALHDLSQRSGGPFVRVNCAAIPDNLLEDELFGHEKGAFTGALGRRKGKFLQAEGGTLFLDEVGDLPLHLQPKILRALQEREIEPVGGNETHKVDLRLVAATHQDLRVMVNEGRFREDLFYRLNVIPLELPPLRERPGDVLLLARHFLDRYTDENCKKISGFTPAAQKKLQAYSWPGNVRELENCVERAVVLSTSGKLHEEDLLLGGPRREGALEAVLDTLLETPLSLEELERCLLIRGLARNGGNLSQTARMLGMTRRALQYRMEKIKSGLKDPPPGGGPEA